jgi:hypothetical protein
LKSKKIITGLVSFGIRLPFGDAVLFGHVATFGHHFGMLDNVHTLLTDLLHKDFGDHFVALVWRGLHGHGAFGVGHNFTLNFSHFVANLQQQNWNLGLHQLVFSTIFVSKTAIFVGFVMTIFVSKYLGTLYMTGKTCK